MNDYLVVTFEGETVVISAPDSETAHKIASELGIEAVSIELAKRVN